MLNYNAPTLTAGGTRSDVDAAGSAQMNTFFWLKKAIIQARKDQYFMPLATVTNMPKHFGKSIKIHDYVPLLDDKNVNDQGLDAAGAAYAGGNLYGSSRDVGLINARLPVLGENGGRVNRVGFTRLTREGSIHKFGFFTEFTQEALDFDSDEMLMDHLSRELLTGATQLTEAVLQRDLLAAPGVTLYAGAAVSNATVTGEGAGAAVVDYADLMRLDQTLTDNRTPKHTTIITGSRNVDTKVVGSCRVLFVGPALVPHLRTLKDPFNNPAFIPVQQYADAGTIMNGEIGAIGHFRIIEVPEMLHWAGVGANETAANPGYRTTSGKYDVYPMLCIGDDSFTTIGFQTDGKTVKFTVMTKMPGRDTATREHDPFGESGFSSIKWYYGILIKRPERIGIIKCVAPE
jgi:N4-gp56 family major capsid protein